MELLFPLPSSGFHIQWSQLLIALKSLKDFHGGTRQDLSGSLQDLSGSLHAQCRRVASEGCEIVAKGKFVDEYIVVK